MNDFKENARMVAAAFARAGVTNVSLDDAARLMPTLKEWEDIAQRVGRRLKGRKVRR